MDPEHALEKFQLEEGFRIEIVAHEPMVVDPIAMDIDADGRLWVIDMPSYMPAHDLDVMKTSALERVPEARVVVLEDTDKDGKISTAIPGGSCGAWTIGGVFIPPIIPDLCKPI